MRNRMWDRPAITRTELIAMLQSLGEDKPIRGQTDGTAFGDLKGILYVNDDEIVLYFEE